MRKKLIKSRKRSVFHGLFAFCFAFMFLFYGATSYAAPNKSEFVTDKANMLSNEDEVKIEASLYEIYKRII